MTLHDSSNVRRPLIVAIILVLLATAAVILRFISRRIKRVAVGPDDWTVVLGLFWTYVQLGLQTASIVDGGVGQHASNLDPNVVVLAIKLMLPIETVYALSMGTIKISILLFFLRIFVTTAFRVAAWIGMAVAVMWGMSVVLEGFLLCRPLAFNWDQTIPGGVCGDRNAAFVAAGAINMITDVGIMLLPLPFIWSLQMSKSNKVALSTVFFLGICICVISIIRLEALIDIKFEDITYTLAPALMWTTIEPCLGIINACLPMMRPFLVAIFPTGFFISAHKSDDGIDPKTFERIEGDSLHLTPYGKGVTRSVVSHPQDSKANTNRNSLKADYESTEQLQVIEEDSIRVQTHWRIQRDVSDNA